METTGSSFSYFSSGSSGPKRGRVRSRSHRPLAAGHGHVPRVSGPSPLCLPLPPAFSRPGSAPNKAALHNGRHKTHRRAQDRGGGRSTVPTSSAPTRPQVSSRSLPLRVEITRRLAGTRSGLCQPQLQTLVVPWAPCEEVTGRESGGRRPGSTLPLPREAFMQKPLNPSRTRSPHLQNESSN